MSYYDNRPNYGEFETLREQLLFKKIVAWTEDMLTLDDGTEITIECSEQDCCAGAGGTFKDVVLDAVITNIEIGREHVTEFEYDGNGGYYYSVCSLVVKDVHYTVVTA